MGTPKKNQKQQLEKNVLADFLELAEEKETSEFAPDNGTYLKFEKEKVYTAALMRETVMIDSTKEGEEQYESVQLQIRDKETGALNLYNNADVVMKSYHSKCFAKPEAEGSNCAIIRIINKGEREGSGGRGHSYADLRIFFLSYEKI